jgi:hypothetical protein
VALLALKLDITTSTSFINFGGFRRQPPEMDFQESA